MLDTGNRKAASWQPIAYSVIVTIPLDRISSVNFVNAFKARNCVEIYSIKNKSETEQPKKI